MSKDPLYLHLLSDRDLVALNPLLGHLREHRDEVLHKLHGLYQSHFGAERALTEEAFLTHYGRDLDAVTRSLAEQDLDILDVIGMMFDFLLEDRNIPYAMKSLLSRLQIPVIKATLSDIGFFRSKDHPVRRVLNNLSQLATTWSDDGDRSEDSLFGRIETWVNRLIMESGRNSESFRHLDLEILAYMEREQTNALATEERRVADDGVESLR